MLFIIIVVNFVGNPSVLIVFFLNNGANYSKLIRMSSVEIDDYFPT